MIRAIVVLVLSLGGGSPGPSNCWLPPVPAPVVEGFAAPACPWCAGHRGVEFGPTTGRPVRAVAGGVVGFAGVVAGVRYVSVDHADGLRATYGWLSSISVTAGQAISTGDVVGTGGPRLMFTLRRDGAYLDPAAFLGHLVRRPWLVPTHGEPGRPPPPAELRCPSG